MTLVKKALVVVVATSTVGGGLLYLARDTTVTVNCGPQVTRPAVSTAFAVSDKITGTFNAVASGQVGIDQVAAAWFDTRAMGELLAHYAAAGARDEPDPAGEQVKADIEAQVQAGVDACCPTPATPPPLDMATAGGVQALSGGSGTVPVRSGLTGPAQAADALRAAAPDDAKWLGQIPLGVAIAKYESRFDNTAENHVFGGHIGFWQISGPNAARLKLGDRHDPYANARYAYALWKGRGGTWAKDWTTYSTALAHVGEFQNYATPGGTGGTAALAAQPAPSTGYGCPSGTGTAGGTLGAATGLRALGSFGSDHSARVLTFADGTRVGTWNSYYGARHPGMSGPTGPDRIRKAMAVIGPQVDMLGGQEFSNASHRAAALDGLGPDFYVVAGDTSQPIWVRKTYALTGQSSDHVFRRTDNYEGPSQGERWVNSAEVRTPSGGTLTFVNLHQLPHIQKGTGLNHSWPKRIGWAKRLWSTALGIARGAMSKGAVVVVGDQNFKGDPDGMYAAAGLTQASKAFTDPVGGRVIDQILYAGTTPLAAPASSTAGGVRTVTDPTSRKTYHIPIPSGPRGVAISYALDQLGKPYRWGAHGPGSFDCSGLVSAAWAKAGVRFTPQTEAMFRELPHTKTPQPGDLTYHPGHTQMLLPGGLILEAPRTGLTVRIIEKNWMRPTAYFDPTMRA